MDIWNRVPFNYFELKWWLRVFEPGRFRKVTRSGRREEKRQKDETVTSCRRFTIRTEFRATRNKT